jgi:hypothetical protein
VRLPSLIVIVAACGGSARTKTPQDLEREAADARRKQLEAERPAKPTELKGSKAFRPTERCGQGPYRIEMPALSNHFAEEFRVYACGIHDIAGNYRYSVHEAGKAPRTVTESAFGWGDRDNGACKVNRGEQLAAGGDSGGTSAAGTTTASSGTTVAASSVANDPAKLKAVTLEPVSSIPTSCTARIEVINMTHTSYGEYPAVKGQLVIEIWSEVPNDLEGMVFVVEQHAAVADMTVERWKAYLDAESKWRERYHAYIDGEVSSGRATVVDTKVTAPPPPPPRDEAKPPQPSKNARWIPGYWLYVKTDFHWIAGMWEVPQADIEQELTVVAPTPPPAAPPPTVAVDVAVNVGVAVEGNASAEVKVEKPVVPPPSPTAVWTPGYWQWDGRAYVWIEGAWRIPPAQGSTWSHATWSVTKRGAVFVPGRWSSGGGRVRDHRRR